ncbi:MAG: hypothetical protein KC652_12415 [Cyanobacteria bacterium HKST-UBA01]|nr:hypothetical protein [Cyanobacteria bacterium HKST-UBA01]
MIKTVAKHRYFKGRRAMQSVKEYTNYVTYRSGRDAQLGGRRFFSKDQDEISHESVQVSLKKQDDRSVVAHELILSPGIQTVDPKEYTRELMEKLERRKGLELEWHAVAHEGDHNHIHVMINGADANGRRVLLRRSDYQELRLWGDSYLEKYHYLDRYLDKEELKFERDFDLDYKRTKGDRLYELLYEEEDSSQKPEEAPPSYDLTEIMGRWNKERAIAELPDQEKIYSEFEVYHKYSKLEELEHLESYLRATRDYLPKEQYGKLASWIREKEEFGCDHHERLSRESFARGEIEKMKDDPEAKKELEEKLARLEEERESRYREEDERREKEREEEDRRLDEERAREDEERLAEREAEEARYEEERKQEDERRAQEEIERQEELEAKRQEQDQKIEEERRLEAIKEKLELAKQAQEERARQEAAKKEEALKAVRDFKEINRDFKRSYQGQSPGEKLFSKKGKEQRIQEARGRHTEWHIRYQNAKSREALEAKLAKEPDLAEKINEDIAKIKEMEARQLEGEKLQKVDIDKLDTSADKYLFSEEELEARIEESREEEIEVEEEVGKEEQETATDKEEPTREDKEEFEEEREEADSKSDKEVDEPEKEKDSKPEPDSDSEPVSDLEIDQKEKGEELEQEDDRDLNQDIDKEELEKIQDQVAKEEELAEEIEFIERDDGSRLSEESDLVEMEEHRKESMDKVRENWDEGAGYVQGDEVKVVALDKWIAAKRAKEAGLEQDQSKEVSESTKQHREFLLEWADNAYKTDMEQAIRFRSSVYLDAGFEDEQGGQFSKDSRMEDLQQKYGQLDLKCPEGETPESLGISQEEYYEIRSQKASIEQMVDFKEPQRKFQVEMAEVRGLDIKSLRNEDGSILFKHSPEDALIEKREQIEAEMKSEHPRFSTSETYLQLVSERAAVDSWLEERREQEISVDLNEMEAIEVGKQLTEIDLGDGEVITPKTDGDRLSEIKTKLQDLVSSYEGAGDKPSYYYENLGFEKAVEGWSRLESMEQSARETGSVNIRGVELEVDDNQLFEDDVNYLDRLDRLERADMHVQMYDFEEKSNPDVKEEKKERIQNELKEILNGDDGRGRLAAEINKLMDEAYEILQDQEKHVEDGFEAYKDEHSEQLYERDELDELIGFPEDEREFDKEVEFLDKGDTGSVGERADNNEQSVDKGSEPTVEASQTEGGRDPGVVDNTDGFRGRDDDNDRDRDDDGLSR